MREVETDSRQVVLSLLAESISQPREPAHPQWRIAIGIVMVLCGIRTVIELFDGPSQIAGAVILIARVVVAIWGDWACGPSN
jgi:hypothetical protein